jgi:iterative type I PKS product template protein
MLGGWVQYPSRENGNSASFDTPIEVLAPFIEGHKVAGHYLCPASIYLEQVLSGAELSRRHLKLDFGKSMAVLGGVTFAKPLVYHPQVNRIVRTHVTIDDKGTGSFAIASRLASSSEESVHVRGDIRFQTVDETAGSLDSAFRVIPEFSTAEVGPRKEAEIFSTRTLYEVVFPRVVEYSAKYHTIQSLTASPNGMDGLAQVKLPNAPRHSFAAHPIFADTLLHTAGFLANTQGDIGDAYICSEVQSFQMLSEFIDQEQSYTVHCRGSWASVNNTVVTEAYAVQAQEPHRVVALMKGIQFKRVRMKGLARALANAADSVEVQARDRTISTSTQSTGGVQTSNSDNSSRPSSPDTLVSEDDIRVRIRDVIAQVLGLPASDIQDQSDFKSLGLDSLSSLEALHALKTELNVDIAHDAFESHSTVASLSTLLDKSPSPKKSLERPQAPQARSVASTVTVTVSGEDSRARIRGVIAEVLGLPVSDIEDDSDFKSLGLDSLSSLEALHALKTELNVDLPHDAFENYSTVTSLNALLNQSSTPQNSVERTPQKSVERPQPTQAPVQSTETVSNGDRRIRIRGIIAEVLGLSDSDIEDDADFKSLGLDSLSSLEALHALKTDLNVDLPHDAFESYSTIASLNAFLDQSSSPKKSSRRSSALRTLQPASFDNRMSRLQTSKDDSAVPLLLIHDGSGLINHYSRMTPLHRDVFALSNPCLITGGKWESVEQIAESYANVVLGAKTNEIIIGGKWSLFIQEDIINGA